MVFDKKPGKAGNVSVEAGSKLAGAASEVKGRVDRGWECWQGWWCLGGLQPSDVRVETGFVGRRVEDETWLTSERRTSVDPSGMARCTKPASSRTAAPAKALSI